MAAADNSEVDDDKIKIYYVNVGENDVAVRDDRVQLIDNTIAQNTPDVVIMQDYHEEFAQDELIWRIYHPYKVLRYQQGSQAVHQVNKKIAVFIRNSLISKDVTSLLLKTELLPKHCYNIICVHTSTGTPIIISSFCREADIAVGPSELILFMKALKEFGDQGATVLLAAEFYNTEEKVLERINRGDDIDKWKIYSYCVCGDAETAKNMYLQFCGFYQARSIDLKIELQSKERNILTYEFMARIKLKQKQNNSISQLPRQITITLWNCQLPGKQMNDFRNLLNSRKYDILCVTETSFDGCIISGIHIPKFYKCLQSYSGTGGLAVFINEKYSVEEVVLKEFLDVQHIIFDLKGYSRNCRKMDLVLSIEMIYKM